MEETTPYFSGARELPLQLTVYSFRWRVNWMPGVMRAQGKLFELLQNSSI